MTVAEPKRIALVGSGLVGRRHVIAMGQTARVRLASVVDPDATAEAFAAEQGVPWFPNLDDLFAHQDPDGVILATPTPLHGDMGRICAAAGCPMLIEKPITATADDGQSLVETAEAADVSILVGHHRRHNPLVQQAHAQVASGALGQVRAFHASCWLYKPDAYFADAPWRTQPGAGPVSVNLAHDIDLMRHLCGEVVSVVARAAPSVRSFANEDLAAAILECENGVIGTLSVSDSTVGPWSWELTAKENPAYPATPESCYWIGGSKGALSLPDLRLWSFGDRDPDWWAPISATSMPVPQADPLVAQLEHFADVIGGTAEPLVSGREGLQTLRVIEAIQRSTATGEAVKLTPPS
ncbi:MAG: Gfo/Idh/MocA family oxidoreductase [Pseudomonadota bacterium]